MLKTIIPSKLIRFNIVLIKIGYVISNGNKLKKQNIHMKLIVFIF